MLSALQDALWRQLNRDIDNDAKALALAEGWLGAARGESDYMAMVVSTGVRLGGAVSMVVGNFLKQRDR